MSPILLASRGHQPVRPPASRRDELAGELRLTLVIAHLGIGGAQKVLVSLANSWAARGWTVTLIAVGDRGPSYFPLHPKVRERSLDLQAPSGNLVRALRNNWLRLLQLRRTVRGSRPDVVLSFLSATNVLTLLATRGLGVPVLVSERSDPKRQTLSAPWRVLRWLTYPLAEHVVVQGDAALAGVAWPSRGRAVVAPNPIQLPANLAVGVQPVIVGVGRLVPLKNFDLLIRAFAANAPACPDWRLVVWGEGPERPRLETLAAEHGLGGRVSLPGRSAAPAAWLAHAGVFALTSSYEGYPNALAEAMAAGLAVVSTACPIGPRTMVRHEVDGLLVRTGDLGELSGALGRVMKDPALRARLGAAGREAFGAGDAERAMATWTKLVVDTAGIPVPSVHAAAHPRPVPLPTADRVRSWAGALWPSRRD
jgi:glycosyltransferase involved in cell wall biosynthesis